MLKVSVDVYLKGTTLHQLSLDHHANKEEHHSSLHLVVAQVFHNILEEIGRRWAKHAEDGVSHEHKTKDEHP